MEIELDNEDNRYVYGLEIVDEKDIVWDINLDARTGELLKRVRGRRLDEEPDGHGPGLAIARDIAEHYQGAIEFTELSLSGLRVVVTFGRES